MSRTLQTGHKLGLASFLGCRHFNNDSTFQANIQQTMMTCSNAELRPLESAEKSQAFGENDNKFPDDEPHSRYNSQPKRMSLATNRQMWLRSDLSAKYMDMDNSPPFPCPTMSPTSGGPPVFAYNRWDSVRDDRGSEIAGQTQLYLETDRMHTQLNFSSYIVKTTRFVLVHIRVHLIAPVQR